MSKSLQILAVSVKDGVTQSAEVKVPYLTGKYRLPTEYPFTVNRYLGPDYGFSLNWVSLDVENDIVTFGFAEIVKLVKGRGEKKLEFSTGEVITFNFEVVD